MHLSAYKNAHDFFQKYCRPGIKVLDVGSLDVNGSLRPIFENCHYTGLDMCPGKNVDVVANAHQLPFGNDFFDVVLSSSNFEHDEMFWLTFREMCRVVKPGGLVYICVPSSGDYHGYPGDCWRFYKDAAAALKKWVAIDFNGSYQMEILDQYLDSNEPWKDNISIFKKQ